MTWRSRLTGGAISAALVAGLLHCAPATAQERKIYKHIDDKGNVVYSEVPPVSGTVVKKLDAQPAYRGRGDNVAPGSPYADPRYPSHDYSQDQYRKAYQLQQQQMEDARQKRLAELEAECNRNRGTDCSNPEVLRYIESTSMPRLPRPHR